jgi:hypothetical protein
MACSKIIRPKDCVECKFNRSCTKLNKGGCTEGRKKSSKQGRLMHRLDGFFDLDW